MPTEPVSGDPQWVSPHEAERVAFELAYTGPDADAAVAALGAKPSGMSDEEWEEKVDEARELVAVAAGHKAHAEAVALNVASGAVAPPEEAGHYMSKEELDELTQDVHDEVFVTKRRSWKDRGNWIGSEEGLIDESEYVTDHVAEGPSDTVFRSDFWTRLRARDLHEAEWNIDEHKNYRFTEDVIADTFESCFDPFPEFAKNPKDVIRQKWFDALMQSDDFRALRSSTLLDSAMSEIGSAQIGQQWVTYYGNLSEEEKQRITGGGETARDELKRIGSTHKASKDARSTVGDAAAAGMGMGMMGGQKVNAKKLMQVFRQVRENTSLKRIMNMAGKMRRAAASLQRRKSKHAQDEVVGVTIAGEISRMIPAELAKFAIPELELDLLRRISEREIMCWEQHGTEPVARGPIVVCVDESGSMSGEPHDNAKALALALGWVAMQQKRWIAFVGFSGGCEGTRLAFAPGEWDQDKLIEWLTHFYGGGTTLDVPLQQLPEVYWPEFGAPSGKTDVVLITDAQVHCPKSIEESFLAWKAKEKAKCYGLVIGGARPGDLEKVCDQCWCFDRIDTGEDAVQQMLSI